MADRPAAAQQEHRRNRGRTGLAEEAGRKQTWILCEWGCLERKEGGKSVWLETLTKFGLLWRQGQALLNSGTLQHFLTIKQLVEKFLC